MKIASSSMAFASQHESSSSLMISERLRTWIGTRPPEGNAHPALPSPAPEVDISAAGHQAQATGKAEDKDDGTNGDPFLALVKSMVEMLLGHKIRLYAATPLTSAQQSTDTSVQTSVANGNPAFGVDYDRQQQYSESETSRFQAAGTIHTTDGQDVSFSLDLQMSRSYVESDTASLRAGNAVQKDPLVINFSGNAAQLQNTRFVFDLTGNGRSDNIPLLASGSAYLALDKNGNGKVDSGQELFGPQSGNGFQDLRQLDSDGNGWLDENDPAFSQLQAWKPDGEGGGMLASLKSLGVGALSLSSQTTPFALKGAANQTLGAVRSSGVYLNENGSAGSLQQVDLSV